MNWKLLAAVALMAVGLGAIAFVVVRPDLGGTQASQYLTAAVTRTDVAKTATASGTLSAHGTYGLSFGNDPQPISGTATTGSSASAGSGTSWLVKAVGATVGKKVKAGDVLATAATTDAQLQVTIAKANLAAAKARLTVDAGGPTALVLAAARDAVAQSQLAYTASTHTRQSTLQQNADAVTQAKGALADAQAQLTSAQAGPTSDAVTAANDSLSQAQLSYQSTTQSANDQTSQNALTLSQASAAVSSASSQLSSAQAKLNADQASLSAAQQRLADDTAGTATLAADQQAVTQAQAAVVADGQAVTQAQAALDSAQSNYNSTSLKVTATENQLASQLAQAQQSLTSAQHQYAAKVAPSQTAIDAANQAVRQAELNLAQAQQKQSSSVTQLADQLAQAQLSLASAQNGYQQKIQPAAADQVASDKASVAVAEVNLATARQTLAHSTLTAPADGTIVAVNVVAGVQAPSGYAITMESGSFQISANFAEADIPSLAVGQPAQVSITATKETATGTVAQITPVAASSAGSSVVTFAVVVVLDPSPATAMAGMSANVSITTALASSVLAVPSTALVGRSGSYGVRVLDGSGQVSLVAVEPGLVTSSLVEIKSGLTEGETVVTGTATTRTGTSTAAGGLGIPGLGGGGGGFQRDAGGTRSGTGTGGSNNQPVAP